MDYFRREVIDRELLTSGTNKKIFGPPVWRLVLDCGHIKYISSKDASMWVRAEIVKNTRCLTCAGEQKTPKPINKKKTEEYFSHESFH